MGNQRSATRRRILKAGKIVFAGGGGIDAIVRNISETGALLMVEAIWDVPNNFGLVVEADGFKRKCQIIWRRPTSIGVRFLSSPDD